MMKRSEFDSALRAESPPAMSAPLTSLWWDAKGNWDAAHKTLQQDDGSDSAGRRSAGRRSAWVHAYLHRKEGDLSNAGYWYRRADKPIASGELADEWCEIVAAMTD